MHIYIYMYKHTEWNRTVFDPRVNEKNKVFFLLPKKYFKCTIDAKSFAFFYRKLQSILSQFDTGKNE